MKTTRAVLFVCLFLAVACSSCVCIEDIGHSEFEVIEDCSEDCHE